MSDCPGVVVEVAGLRNASYEEREQEGESAWVSSEEKKTTSVGYASFREGRKE